MRRTSELYETLKFETDVLVAGGGAAGMYAAVAAARNGARVLLIDKNVRVDRFLRDR